MNSNLPRLRSADAEAHVAKVTGDDFELTRDAAEQLDGRIRRLAEDAGQQIVLVGQLLDEAKRGHIHQVLGFPSWTAYVADALGGARLQLSGESRQAMLELMSTEGMSVRAIAAGTGVPKSSVARFLPPPVPTGTPGGLVPITGTDGKTYPRPRPPAPTTPRKRRPFPAQFDERMKELYRPVTAVTKLLDDDRFPNYAKTHEKSGVVRRNLVGVIAALQRVVDQLPDDGFTRKLVEMNKTGPVLTSER